nr:Ubiquitinol-cytochrome C reductase Fe-S subunit TAT signal [uncultured bacterium]APO33799.1 Ubiquitinol-cytochrome C reductase Fe-S subunit TAT signal [uncultured bacterium]
MPDCPFQEWENRRDFLYAYAIQAASQGTEKGE